MGFLEFLSAAIDSVDEILNEDDNQNTNSSQAIIEDQERQRQKLIRQGHSRYWACTRCGMTNDCIDVWCFGCGNRRPY